MQTRRLLIVLMAAVLTFSAFPALAQQDSSVAQGQLLKVDASAKTIAIRTAPGAQMVFRYTERTKVMGADGEVAGLATKAGAQVSIKYVQEDKEKVATEIQVQAKQ
jgi:hypothetical protein